MVPAPPAKADLVRSKEAKKGPTKTKVARKRLDFTPGAEFMTASGRALYHGTYADGSMEMSFPDYSPDPTGRWTVGAEEAKRSQPPQPMEEKLTDQFQYFGIPAARPRDPLDPSLLQAEVPAASTRARLRQQVTEHATGGAPSRGGARHTEEDASLTGGAGKDAADHPTEPVTLEPSAEECIEETPSTPVDVEPEPPPHIARRSLRLARTQLLVKVRKAIQTSAMPANTPRPNRVRNLHQRSRYAHVKDVHSLIGVAIADEVDADLPRFYHQTLRHPLRPLIEDGEAKELTGLLNLQCFGPPAILPKGEKPIPLMWVYKAKGDTDNLLVKIKGRLTLMGNYEKSSVSAMDAYAPVANPVSLRLLLALHIGDPKCKFYQLDVRQAYLSTPLKRRVYVSHPPGYILYMDSKGAMTFRLRRSEPVPNTAMRLLLALYGGRECGRLFYDAYVQWHRDNGFEVSHYEKCFLSLKTPDGSFIKLCFHVDDSLIVVREGHDGDKLWQWYLKALRKRFEYELGPLEKFLGMRIRIDYANQTIAIDQEAQCAKMLNEFGMSGCKPEKNLFPTGPNPSKADVPVDVAEQDKIRAEFDMRSACGHLNYIQMISRPDISLPLKILSKYMGAYGRRHVALAKHVMRYLKGSAGLPLIFRGGGKQGVQVFTDASHAGDPDGRRSITGVVIKVNGCTVFWLCAYQKIVSHSSCESELMALDKGVTVGVFVRWLVGVISHLTFGTTSIFVDNRSTIDISSNPVQPGRDRHIHARYFYVRDCVAAGSFRVRHIRSELQVADILCSFKGMPNFRTLLALIMGCATVELDTSASSDGSERKGNNSCPTLKWNASLLQ